MIALYYLLSPAKMYKFRSCRLILPRISFECNVNTAFSYLLFSRTGSSFIAYRQFLPVRFSMQGYSLRTVAKYRHANGFRMFAAASHKSQIGFQPPTLHCRAEPDKPALRFLSSGLGIPLHAVHCLLVTCLIVLPPPICSA